MIGSWQRRPSSCASTRTPKHRQPSSKTDSAIDTTYPLSFHPFPLPPRDIAQDVGIHRVRYSAAPRTQWPLTVSRRSRISLISKSDIKYVGVLHEINSENSTVALENVRSYGTEGRRGNPAEEVAGSDNTYEYIVFRGSDVKELSIVEPPKENKQPQMPDDPAIMGVRISNPSRVRIASPGFQDEILLGCKSFTLAESANIMRITPCCLPSDMSQAYAHAMLEYSKRTLLTVATVNAPSTSTAAASARSSTEPTSAAVPPAASALPSLRLPTRPAASESVRAATALPRTRWTAWLPRQPRRGARIRWLRRTSATTRIQDAALRTAARSRLSSRTSRSILPRSDAYWPAWTAQTSYAEPDAWTDWHWQQARHTAT